MPLSSCHQLYRTPHLATFTSERRHLEFPIAEQAVYNKFSCMSYDCYQACMCAGVGQQLSLLEQVLLCMQTSVEACQLGATWTQHVQQLHRSLHSLQAVITADSSSAGRSEKYMSQAASVVPHICSCGTGSLWLLILRYMTSLATLCFDA